MIFDALSILVKPEMLFVIAIAIAVFATILTLAMPLLANDELSTRMKTAAIERDKIRQRERARMAAEKGSRPSLTNEAKPFLKQIVDGLNLRNKLADENTSQKLKMAGLRGQKPLTTFLFLRLVLPMVFFLVAILYMFVLLDFQQPFIVKFGIACVVGYLGFYAPIIYLTNRVKKRQLSIMRAWPDALDLSLICVESGMSIEAAFRKVSEEVGTQSVPLAEEMILTNAELSYLQDRRTAYENLSSRTGLDGVRSVCTTLIQAERYGTPLGTSLRVLAQENRDMRMNLAEKKAAALPPKLTVPMIVFFLPVLFAVIMGPAIIQVSRTF